jgi:hypothetical protein
MGNFPRHDFIETSQFLSKASSSYLSERNMKDSPRSIGTRVLALFCIYLIATGVFSTGFAILTLVYALFPTPLINNFLRLFEIIVPLILLGIGMASLLPISEHAYTRQAAINPAMARESMRQRKGKPEKRELGILMGIVGITIVLRINPWEGFFFFILPLWGIPIVTVLMVITLILIIMLYKKIVRSIREV